MLTYDVYKLISSALPKDVFELIGQRHMATKNKFAVGLIRVSTATQDLIQQADKVKAEMHKDGYDDEHIILIQDKESGVKLSEEDRNGLNKLKEYIIDNPDIEVVYSYELSRISRRPKVLYSIRDFLIEHNVQLIILTPYMRLLDNGRISQSASVIFSVFGAMAEQEIFLLKERTKRGRAKRVDEGKYDGGHILYGYYIDEDGFFHINEDEAAIVKRIFDMCTVYNYSGYYIGRTLYYEDVLKRCGSEHNAVTYVNRMLSNKSYCGEGRLKYPAIISKEQFELAHNNAVNRRNKEKTASKYPYLCRNLLFDKTSGYAMNPIHKENCYAFARTGYKTCTLSMSKIEKWVWEYVLPLTKRRIDVKSQIAANVARTAKVKSLVTKNDVKLKKLLNLYLNGNLGEAEYSASHSELMNEKQKLESQLFTCNDEADRLYALKLKYAGRNYLPDDVDYSDEEKPEITREVINKIYVTTTAWRRHHIEIHRNDGVVDEFDLNF